MSRDCVARYAVGGGKTRGRRYEEQESPSRTPWQRDRDRILHADSFRTLQYKTQVFINHEGDFFRTRLTHSLEVAQIARSIARALHLNEDLTEALALAHDLGHTPFGHAGEQALQQSLANWGGFDHNVQSLRVVTKLEQRYFGFKGLNLTWETLEGLVKHNGPKKDVGPYLQSFCSRYQIDYTTFASAEAQVAALSDDIAYHGHDLDDGLRAGLLTLDDISDLAVVGDAFKSVRQRAPAHAVLMREVRHETIRSIIDTLIMDITEQSRKNLDDLNPQSVDEIREAAHPVIGFSPNIERANREIRAFLYLRVYWHWRVRRTTRKAAKATSEIFAVLANEPDLLPDYWCAYAKEASGEKKRRIVADYIAAMTDRCALDEHRRLTDLSVLS